MKKRLVFYLGVFFAVLIVSRSEASLIDFSSWSPIDWNVSANHSASAWNAGGFSGSYAYQLNTSGPSAYLNNLSRTDYEMEGKFRVCSTAPFGVVGFIFGYQDPSHFYLLDWRRFNGPSVGVQGIGLSIKKFSAPSASDLDLFDFQSSQDTEYMEVLASFHGPYNRWAPFATYGFYLDFGQDHFRVKISNTNTRSTIWEVAFEDTAFGYGQFGLYSFSQGAVLYSGFNQSGGSVLSPPETAPVPEPATVLLFAVGLGSLAGLRSRQRSGKARHAAPASS